MKKKQRRYRLTWKGEQGGRWKKVYKGKTYYFPRREGETKPISYLRCWKEWLKKKAELDLKRIEDDPSRQALRNGIRRAREKMAEIQFEGADTEANRYWWTHWAQQLEVYQWLLDNGIDAFNVDVDPENPPEFLNHPQPWHESPPPWEQAPEMVEPEKSVKGNVDCFLRRKQGQVERGERSAGRYDTLRVGLEDFAKQVGEAAAVESVSTQALLAYRDRLERLIGKGELRPHTARDRLQSVKQFTRWAWENELIDLPRILNSRDFAISLPEQQVNVFTDEELRRLLAASPESTRLYLLLMLNCGMTQQDISDLRRDEVDLKLSRITRKRSKTRKNVNGASVPEVSYPLWPETSSLLRQHVRKGAHATLALTNRKGTPLKTEVIVDRRVKKSDNIRSAYNRVVRKLAESKEASIKIKKPLKLLRKTAATKLGEHSEYGRFAQYFLGHAPSTIADKHYVKPNQEQFDQAVTWLGTQFLGDREGGATPIR